MAAFTDKLGRSWIIDITKGDVRRLEKLGIPFGELLGDLSRLAKEVGNAQTFDRILWPLIESQAKAAGVDKDSFDDGWNGETEEAAGLAFVDAVLSFSPARKSKGEWLETFRAMEQKQLELERARLREATEIALEMMGERSTSTSSASNSPPSPGSETAATE